MSDLRSQIYPENGLDPFPGEGRVVGLQRIRKPLDSMEHPGELSPAAEPGDGSAVPDKLQVGRLHYHSSPRPTKAPQCLPYRLQNDCREVSEQAPQICDPTR